jgi:hypothetical protein
MQKRNSDSHQPAGVQDTAVKGKNSPGDEIPAEGRVMDLGASG